MLQEIIDGYLYDHKFSQEDGSSLALKAFLERMDHAEMNKIKHCFCTAWAWMFLTGSEGKGKCCISGASIIMSITISFPSCACSTVRDLEEPSLL